MYIHKKLGVYVNVCECAGLCVYVYVCVQV